MRKRKGIIARKVPGPKRLMVIGVTGSFGSGKTTVSRMFARCGARVLDADRTARDLLKVSSGCFKKIVRCFGRSVLTQGKIDRRKLAEVVFADARKRRQLERIIHPRVAVEFKRRIALLRRLKNIRAVVLDVPLLFESGMHRLADVTVVVWVSTKTQLGRVAARRGIAQSAALARIRAQLPLPQKVRRADAVINNNRTLNYTQKQVRALWSAFMKKI